MDSPATLPNHCDHWLWRLPTFTLGEQINYWATWPAPIGTFAILDAHLAAARVQVAANPSLILVGMLEIAASLGLIGQLDWAIAQMIGIISGPLIPLAAAVVNPFYVASSVFGEMGSLLVPPLTTLHMQLKTTDMSKPMRGPPRRRGAFGCHQYNIWQKRPSPRLHSSPNRSAQHIPSITHKRNGIPSRHLNLGAGSGLLIPVPLTEPAH